jgi:transcriptional regulator with XRE-family HTH domain
VLVADRVGAAVRARRLEQGMSAVQLSKRTAELGYPITRGTIAKIESNSRNGKLDLTEVMALAAALEVPPILLVYPDGPFKPIEMLPDMPEDSIRAAMWFTGEWTEARQSVLAKKLASGSGAQPIELMREFITAQRMMMDAATEMPKRIYEVREAQALVDELQLELDEKNARRTQSFGSGGDAEVQGSLEKLRDAQVSLAVREARVDSVKDRMNQLDQTGGAAIARLRELGFDTRPYGVPESGADHASDAQDYSVFQAKSAEVGRGIERAAIANGEVERLWTALLEHPGVRRASARAFTLEPPAGTVLVGYVELSPDGEVSISDLKRYVETLSLSTPLADIVALRKGPAGWVGDEEQRHAAQGNRAKVADQGR